MQPLDQQIFKANMFSQVVPLGAKKTEIVGKEAYNKLNVLFCTIPGFLTIFLHICCLFLTFLTGLLKSSVFLKKGPS